MRITILAVGRLRPYYREACDDYAGRLSRYARIDEIEVREAARAPSPGAQRTEEAARLTARRPPGSVLVALARAGTPWSSELLAERLGEWRDGSRHVALAIGGSHGLDDALVAGSAARWSLGPLTLPHELARVIVLEQVYRAFTILRGERYHKGR